jgi:imidazoleglycerol phosphate synthase cyclase subunit
MLTRRVIPCLDCRDGRVVKGVRFAGLRDAGSPVELAAAYEAQGADEIVLLDVSATTEGRANQLETVRAVRRALSIPLAVGGGVRTADDAAALLEAGADKVGVNTAAVQNPALLTELAERFGCQCVVLAIDAAERRTTFSPPCLEMAEEVYGACRVSAWEVVTHAGQSRTGRDAVMWAVQGAQRGAGEILLTSWDRDGTHSGYDLDLIAAVSAAVRVPVIASGGAADAAHMVAALRAGADAVLAASIFHDGRNTVGDVKRTLAEAGVEVRR